MTAGHTAGTQSRHEALFAEKQARTAAFARRTAARHAAKSRTERDVVGALAPLGAVGFHILPDRGWPGTRSAQVDLVVIGPSGLFIVDTRSWSDVTIDAGRVFRGEFDVTDDLASLADLAYATEARMAELGLAAGEVHALVVLAGRSGVRARIGTVEMVGEIDVARYILSRGLRLRPSQVESVVAASLDYFPIMHDADAPEAAVIAPIDDGEDPEYDTIPLLTNRDVTRQLEDAVAAPSIDEWMTFLDPEQARLIRRSFGGPARIRGAAGTGKTVVGLHRAAYLARSAPGVVLVTSFVSTLPAVLGSLMHRLAPDISDRIEFVGTTAFARRLLTDRGIASNLQPAVAESEFDTAWRLVGKPGTLGRIEGKPSYWDDEIQHVIKGRGIHTFDEYAALARTGRHRGLTIEQRRAVWELFLAYQERMRARGAHDSADIVTLAERSLREHALERYSAVIVDEAQDLSAMMIRMLHHLVGNRPDGLTLIGDGQQTIYPGGFTLGDVGVSLAGRGVVLETNYRNTAEIIDFASELVADDEFLDIEGTELRGDRIEPIARSGPPPLVVRFTNRAAHDAEIPRRVRAIASAENASYGDIGILALSTFGVRAAIASLVKANVPFVELTNFDGHPSNAVKVGTVKRAKGLDFAQVMLVQVPSNLLPAEDAFVPTPDDAASEQLELNRRELYVAMTRARESLWIGTVP
jgi:hypothetical protein